MSPIGSNPHFRHGVDLLLERKWFEAHEALEQVWRTCAGTDRRVLQGLIQAAVSLEHLRRGNPVGARGQWRKARAKLDPPTASFYGIRTAAWIEALERFYLTIDLDGRADGRLTGDVPDSASWPVPDCDLPPLDPPAGAE